MKSRTALVNLVAFFGCIASVACTATGDLGSGTEQTNVGAQGAGAGASAGAGAGAGANANPGSTSNGSGTSSSHVDAGSKPSGGGSLGDAKDAGSAVDANTPPATTGDDAGSTNSDDDASSTSTDKPGPSNTGPTNAAALKASGSITVTKDGTTIENVDISGALIIQANNVTVKNFRVSASGDWSVQVMPGYTNALLQDGEVTGDGDGLWLRNVTIERLEIHDLGADGMKGMGDNVTVRGCWIHHLGMSAGSHADGLQLMSGSHYVVSGNNFDMPWYLVEGGQRYLSNSNFFLNAYPANDATVDDILIDKNWLNGGNFSVYSLGQSNTRVTNNVFGADSQFGLLNGSAKLWSGNTWAADGTEAH